MPTTFDEVMSFHPGNPDVYEEIRDSINQLLPFVGAGLTAPVYGGWNDLIKELSTVIASDDARRRITTLATSDPEGAAQLLEDTIGEIGLKHRMVHHLSRKKLEDRWATIEGGALWLLPELFACPVLTTNFDEAIEVVYSRRGFAPFPVLDPTSPDLRGQATRLRNTPCVFKLHGTVSGAMMDYSRLVLTREQYEEHYVRGGEARDALRAFVDRRSVIFLGCSLAKGGDRTVGVLEDAAGPGTIHFAIVSCKLDERDQRVRDLADANIRAILYEDGKYDSVTAVLQKLMNDTRRS